MAASTREIPANDFAAFWRVVGADVGEAVERVGASGWYVLGREVEQFERDLAGWWGVGDVVGCASGLDGIEIALRALDLPPGTRILTTPLSAYATALAILRAGHVPAFCDVDASGQLDPERCGDLMDDDPSLGGILPVHLFGHAADLDALEAIAERSGVPLVEDCAQAIGARSHGRVVGGVGAVGATSFYPTKNLGALGDGGAVVTGDAGIAHRARVLRDYGQERKYVHGVPGLNSRLDELHAAILRTAILPHLSAWTSRRQEIARRYQSTLASNHLDPLPVPSGSTSVWHLYPVVVADPERRDALLAHLREAGIGASVHYPLLITDQAALVAAAGAPDVRGPLTTARRLASCEVSLPISPFLSDDDIDHVVAVCNGWRG